MMTPRVATLAFTHEYLKAFVEYSKLMGDGPYIAVAISKKIDLKAPEKWKHWKTITKLRQWADEQGMKYWEFWELAFEGHIEIKLRNTFLNAFLNKRLRQWIINKYKVRFGYFIRYSESPFFKPEKYEGHRLQDAYYESLLAKYAKNPKNCTSEKILQLVEDGILSMDFLKNRKTKGKLPHTSDA